MLAERTCVGLADEGGSNDFDSEGAQDIEADAVVGLCSADEEVGAISDVAVLDEFESEAGVPTIGVGGELVEDAFAVVGHCALDKRCQQGLQ